MCKEFIKKLFRVIGSFKESGFWKAMLPLAIPIALQNLLTNSFQLVDTLMIGQLGDEVIAAVGSAGRISFFAGIVIFGFASGGAVFLAQYWGAKDMRGVKRTYGMVLICTMAFSTLLALVCFIMPRQVMSLLTNDPFMIENGAEYLKIACFSYIGIAITQTCCTVLRCTENVKLPMAVSFIAVIMNAALNYVLIFGKLGLPAMGVRGAALATTISALINPILLLLLSIGKKNIVLSRVKDILAIDRAYVKEFIQRATPVLINELLWVVGMTVYDMVFGRMGQENYTALTVFRTVENVAFVFFVGICNACNVMVGKSIGKGKLARAKLDAARFMLLVPVFGLVTGSMLILLRMPILSLFDISSNVKSVASWLIIIYSIEMGLRNIPYISIVGIFRSGGDTRSGMYFEMADYYLLAIPLTVICGLVLKLDFLTVYLLMLLAEDIPKSILCIWRFVSMKWIKPVKLGKADEPCKIAAANE